MATKKYLAKEDMTSQQLILFEQGFTFDDKGVINGLSPNRFAEYIKESYELIYSSDNNFYVFDKGVWEVVDEGEIRSDFYNEIMSKSKSVWCNYLEKEYMTSLKRLIYTREEFNTKRHLINMKNGMFDTVQLKLIPHEAEFLSTIQIPVVYDKKAKCDLYLGFLKQVFENDVERIQKAIEWLGYCISTETKAQKALIQYGSGSNGKGVFTESISWIVGEDNLSHIPLNELDKNFSRATLFGKTVNISSENEMGGENFRTQFFKAITGEDTIHAEFKNKPVFTFKPTVKMVISMNNLPQTKDRSDGYYRRLDFLHFSKHFSDDEKDRDLKKKLYKELAGIFNLAVSGLVTLRKNEFKFTDCANSDAILKDYKSELNPMIDFFDDCLIETDNRTYREDNKRIYCGFKDWATENGHKGFANITNRRFWREFNAEVTARKWQVEPGRSDSYRYRKGVKLVTEIPSMPHERRVIKRRPNSKNINDMFPEDEFGGEVGQKEKK